jgi:predicted  nucleic acid-binding Zn-ribbon protein
MDRDRFDNLEAHVVSLVEAFARVKEENQRLHQDITQLQAALQAQQKEMESLRPEREELLHLRTLMQAFFTERGVIRQKLEQMLSTIEWLEGHSRLDSETTA